jgi:hypothetical protein
LDHFGSLLEMGDSCCLSLRIFTPPKEIPAGSEVTEIKQRLTLAFASLLISLPAYARCEVGSPRHKEEARLYGKQSGTTSTSAGFEDQTTLMGLVICGNISCFAWRVIGHDG